MARFKRLAHKAGFDPARFTDEQLVGMLQLLTRWADHASREHAPQGPEFVLRVFRAPSGQWTGKLLSGDVEVDVIAGCTSAHAVEDAVREIGIIPDRVEVMPFSGQLPE